MMFAPTWPTWLCQCWTPMVMSTHVPTKDFGARTGGGLLSLETTTMSASEWTWTAILTLSGSAWEPLISLAQTTIPALLQPPNLRSKQRRESSCDTGTTSESLCLSIATVFYCFIVYFDIITLSGSQDKSGWLHGASPRNPLWITTSWSIWAGGPPRPWRASTGGSTRWKQRELCTQLVGNEIHSSCISSLFPSIFRRSQRWLCQSPSLYTLFSHRRIATRQVGVHNLINYPSLVLLFIWF